MVTSIFETVSEVITGLMGNITTLLSGVGNLFYDSTTTTPGLTIVGILSIFALGIGLVAWGIKFVKGLLPKSV